MRRIVSLLAGWMVGALLLNAPAHAGYSAHYIFGDSLSDTGNFNMLTGGALPAPYWNGRFSNGPVYTEIVSNALGLSANPFFGGGGSNYAVGGARVASHPQLGPNASVQGQLDLFLDPRGGSADGNALYTLYAGSNDVFDAFDLVLASGNPNDGLAAVFASANALGQSLGLLAASGARTIIVPTVTDLGLTPAVAAAPAALRQLLSGLADGFNDIVDGFIQNLLASNSGLRIVRPDIYAMLDDAVANPAAYGFTNVTTPCYDGYVTTPGTSVCANPDQTLFWDLIHPTAVGQEAIARAVLFALPEPQALLLLGVGLALLGLSRQRAKLR